MDPIQNVELLEGGRVLRTRWESGLLRRFHAIWLRDNAPDSDTRSPVNGQRLLTLGDLPLETRVLEARIDDAGLEVTFDPDRKTVCFDADWLKTNAYDGVEQLPPAWVAKDLETWNAASLRQLPEGDFDTVGNNPAALRDWLRAAHRFGVAKLSGAPTVPGTVTRVAELFGYVRETNYGRLFDVRAEPNPENLAYTGLALQVHTDNPYRDPVPTLQLLHCLENSATGGDSIVVDGFRAVQLLRDQAPGSFEVLTRYCARFRYTGQEGVDLRARRPMVELGPDGELVAVRFNNRAASAVDGVPFEQMPAFYQACRKFEQILEAPEMKLTFKLAPGECFMLDNTRVLHARTGFTGTGSRWLQGCYADRDGLLSKLRVLQSQIPMGQAS